MTKADLDGAALVHQAAFVRQQNSLEWLQCNLNASPRFLNFIVESEGEIVGYIVWVQKSGFRPEAVLELEQLAVLPSAHGRGFGRKLILDSLPQVKHQLAKQGSTLK
ncbi:GNAT family N-acetyltransferase, partial [Vibrio splendidus]